MILSFQHTGLERFLVAGQTDGIRPDHAKRLRTVLLRLEAARIPKEMNLPGLRLHQLSGNLSDFYTVSISGNWRVIFRSDGHEVREVNYLDYH
jgi:proteic killer suppression protein